MCGRYTITHSTEEILQRFQVLAEQLDIAANYNVAPSHMVPVIIAETSDAESHSADEPSVYRYLQICKWGFIPFYAKDGKSAKPLINARAESLKDKAAFKRALTKRRCIIPADGFYEWKKDRSRKIPMRFRLNGDKLFGFAGLYQDWKDPDGAAVRTVAIVTTSANDTVRSIHDRMPVILTLENEKIWLDPTIDDLDAIEHCLLPYPNDDLAVYVVSTLVNKVSVNSPELLLECAEEQAEPHKQEPGPPVERKKRKSASASEPAAEIEQLKLQLS